MRAASWGVTCPPANAASISEWIRLIFGSLKRPPDDVIPRFVTCSNVGETAWASTGTSGLRNLPFAQREAAPTPIGTVWNNNDIAAYEAAPSKVTSPVVANSIAVPVAASNATVFASISAGIAFTLWVKTSSVIIPCFTRALSVSIDGVFWAASIAWRFVKSSKVCLSAVLKFATPFLVKLLSVISAFLTIWEPSFFSVSASIRLPVVIINRSDTPFASPFSIIW